MTKLTINKKNWTRGKASFLWDEGTSCGCVIGHYMKECEGIDTTYLHEMLEPCHVFKDYGTELNPEKSKTVQVDYDGDLSESGSLVGTVLIEDADWVDTAMSINDDASISDELRQVQLVELFKAVGVELEFV